MGNSGALNRWRKGYAAKVKADVAAAEMERIRGKHGSLTAEVVVDESRPEAAPLHPEFEWDDFKAAEHYRTYQARTMIRAIEVVIESGDAEPRPVYTLAQAADEERTSYHPTEIVVVRPDLLSDALSRLEDCARKSQGAVDALLDAAKSSGAEPDRLARIVLAQKAFQAAAATVAALH